VRAVPAREVAGVTLPETERADGASLRLNGAGVRTRFVFVKVYVIGLYLERPERSADRIMGSDTVRRVELHMLRAASGPEIGAAIADGFARNSGPSLPQLKERLDRLTGMFPAVARGTVVTLTATPDRGTLVAIDGREVGAIEGADFASALLAVWLGPHPVDPDLKRALLGE
jgi:hypothetical protein